MTNKEFYGDKLLAVTLELACRILHRNAYGESCARKKCEDCEFYTVERIENWLNAEHVKPEPPLLKNGDGLKPGDLIMVRNGDDGDWEKLRFVCYHNNIFWTLYDNGDWFHISSKIIPWAQARLPMEGE